MTSNSTTRDHVGRNASSRFLTLADVLSIHEDQITRYGGSASIRDGAGLDAALLRPTSGYYADCLEEAAALWESLAQNHPFIDGNKRTAFATTHSFLALNGQIWQADSRETGDFIYSLYGMNSFTFAHILPWLQRILRPAPAGETEVPALTHYQSSRERFSPLYQRLAQEGCFWPEEQEITPDMFRAFLLSIPILAFILGISTAYKLARGPVSMTLLTLLCTGLYFAGLCLLALNGLAFFAIAYQHILGLLA